MDSKRQSQEAASAKFESTNFEAFSVQENLPKPSLCISSSEELGFCHLSKHFIPWEQMEMFPFLNDLVQHLAVTAKSKTNPSCYFSPQLQRTCLFYCPGWSCEWSHLLSCFAALLLVPHVRDSASSINCTSNVTRWPLFSAITLHFTHWHIHVWFRFVPKAMNLLGFLHTLQWWDQAYAHGLLSFLSALPQSLVLLFVPLNISDTSHLARPGICPPLSDFSLTFDFSNFILSFEQACFSFSHFFHLCSWA